MTKREAILNAINHKNCSVIPSNVETTKGFDKKLIELDKTGRSPDEILNNHMLRKKYKLNTVTVDGELDLFSVLWSPSKDGGDVGIVTRSPMKEDFEGYKFPEINVPFAKKIVEDLEKEKERYTMFSITMGFFERAWSLYGMEDLLMDMIAEPERVEYIFNKIFEHHSQLLDAVLPGKFDAIYFGDDWGQQNGLIMGPHMWRKYIKPHVSKLFRMVKDAGKQIVLHSCGDLREIMGEVIDMGVDVYNTVQPEIYDLKKLKSEYGKDITFYGGISTQQFLPFATKEEVEEETKRVLDIMATGGGYILSPTHAVTDDIPPENILALLKTGREF